MIKLFLDDKRDPFDKSWIVVRNYKEFVEHVKYKGIPNVISFDHDLAPEHYNNAMYKGVEAYETVAKNFKINTGKDCAQWLVNHCVESGFAIPLINVHSANPAGGKLIANVIRNFQMFYYGKDVGKLVDPYPSMEFLVKNKLH